MENTEDMSSCQGSLADFSIQNTGMAQFENGLIRRNTDDLAYDGVAPRVDVCTRTNPLRLRGAALQGLYYVYIMKLGTVASDTNYWPWRDYSPKPDWLDAWWLAQKLSHAQYSEYSVQFRHGHAKRRLDHRFRSLTQPGNGISDTGRTKKQQNRHECSFAGSQLQHEQTI